MNTILQRKLRICLFTAIFGAWQLYAHALPKAAENEEAPVVIAADVAKPKATSKKPAKKEVQKKAPPAAKPKPHNPPPAPKKGKTTSEKK